MKGKSSSRGVTRNCLRKRVIIGVTMNSSCKVSINVPVLDEPFGGGQRFVRALSDYLQEQGCQVIDHLADTDVNIILLVSPLPFQVNKYTYLEAAAYQLRY